MSIMRKSVLALALAPALLAGCSSNSPEAASTPGGVTPSPATTLSAPPADPPALPGSTTPARPKTAPPPTPNNGATVHAVPGRPVPPVAALRTGWITAKVTKGGLGPCFTLTSSDGVTYAAYSELGLQLSTGSSLRARIKPGKTPVNCGSGRAVRLEHVQIAG
jgi:hypothetical protein